MSGITDEAGKLISENSRTLAPAAVGSQVVLMSTISVSTRYYILDSIAQLSGSL